MKIRTRPLQGNSRFLPAVLAGTLGILLAGIGGCRQRDVSTKQAPSLPETTAKPTEATSPAESWTGMEALEPDKWVAIEGASDLEWNKESRVMSIAAGPELSGVRWAGSLPAVPYVVELEARRMSGSDFFCGLTFPVRSATECVTLIVGGWGGSLVGISSIDGLDASENSTGSQHEFENLRWYRIRIEVRGERLQAWIDDDLVVDAETGEQKLSLREGPIEACAPLGLATWQTSAEVRGVRWRKLP